MFTEQLSESLSIQGAISPSNHTNNTDATLPGVDMSLFKRLMAIINIGVLGGTNVQAYWRASANSNMNVTTNVAASIPLVASTANKVETMEVRADQLPAGTRYCQLVVITNTAGTFVDVVVLGGESAYKPAKNYDLAQVDQRIVT